MVNYLMNYLSNLNIFFQQLSVIHGTDFILEDKNIMQYTYWIDIILYLQILIHVPICDFYSFLKPLYVHK